MEYFIAGLPRSGSTLLSSILIQNPNIHSDVTSPVYGIFNQILSADYNTTNDLITDEKCKQILRSVVTIAYNDIQQPIIFDLNRLWTTKLDVLFDIFPDTKIVCCVRDIVSILNSFEHLFQANKFKNAGMIYGGYIDTVYHRCDNLMNWSGVVGSALCGLKQALASSYREKIRFIEYDDLVSNPKEELRALYDFLDIEWFNHQFTDIKGVETAKISIDTSLKGLHVVRPVIAKIERNISLPTDLINNYSNMESWRYL
jgi:sulfotransferase